MKYISYIFLGLIILSGCEKAVDVGSPDFQLLKSTVFENESTADAAVQDLYAFYFGANGGVASPRLDYTSKQITGMLALEFTSNYGANIIESYDLNPEFIGNTEWQSSYAMIYRTNAIIEGLGNKKFTKVGQLKGEALFFRAWMYLQLVNLFGDVPLLTTTDVGQTSKAGRTDVQKVYDLITTDLEEAVQKLPTDYNNAGGKKLRVNKWGAAALLARVYLYKKDWQKADIYASQVINSGNFGLSPDLKKVFDAASPEAIWQVATASYPINFLVFGLEFSFGGVHIDSVLLNSFEPGDLRKQKWLMPAALGGNTVYAQNKFTSISLLSTEWPTPLRLAEVYLIRAEAKVHLGQISDARTDLNVIRNRAGLANTTANTQQELLLAIEKERYVELFAEGHRWFDIKRTGRAESILNGLPGFQSTDLLYPIPQIEITKNPNLTQNPGY